jgi:hypothetical protein
MVSVVMLSVDIMSVLGVILFSVILLSVVADSKLLLLLPKDNILFLFLTLYKAQRWYTFF